MSSQAFPKIYVIAHRSAAQEMISKELGSEPMELIPLTDEQQYFETLNDIEAGCILVDVSTNPADELQTIASIRARQQRMQVIAFSDQWQVATAVKAIKLGAMDVCEFPTSGSELTNAIKQALTCDPKRPLELQNAIPGAILERLTVEETRLLRLIVRGLRAKEISVSLDISVRTFHYRKQALVDKLGVQSRTELIEMIRVSCQPRL